MIMSRTYTICVTGPESTGKTTLCRELSTFYNSIIVPEYAREYFRDKEYDYTPDDLDNIADGQVALLKKAKVMKSDIILYDTDMITMKIWSQYVFRSCSDHIMQLLEEENIDLYLLCYPDINWEEDRLRNARNDRPYIFDQFDRELRTAKKKYRIIKGSGHLRVLTAKLAINEMIASQSNLSNT